MMVSAAIWKKIRPLQKKLLVRPLKPRAPAKRHVERGNSFDGKVPSTACHYRENSPIARSVRPNVQRFLSLREIQPEALLNKAETGVHKRFFQSKERSSTSRKHATTRC